MVIIDKTTEVIKYRIDETFEKLFFRRARLTNLDYIQSTRHSWILRFIQHNYPHTLKRVHLNGVFGGFDNIRQAKTKNEVSIFFTGENVEDLIVHKNQKIEHDSEMTAIINDRVKKYGNYCLDEMDLSLGFGYRDDKNYVRFPLWLMYIFSPVSTYDDVRNKVEKLRYCRNIDDRSDKIVVINKHDNFGMRSRICDELESAGLSIEYGGTWRNNTDSLIKEYEDNKYRYLSDVRFNICAENMDASGYCTEKLFQSFEGGTIPIYAGSENKPEPDIINRDAILFWNIDSDKSNEDSINLIKDINESASVRKDFMRQPRLIEGAEEIIWEKYFVNFRNKLEKLL